MKALFLLIVAATFSQTMAKLLLLELDKEKGKESQDDSDLVEHHGRREEEANEKDFHTKETEVVKRVELTISTISVSFV